MSDNPFAQFEEILSDAKRREDAAKRRKDEADKAKAAVERERLERVRLARAAQDEEQIKRWIGRFVDAVIRYYQHLPENKRWSTEQIKQVLRYCVAITACDGTLPPIESQLEEVVRKKFVFGLVLMRDYPDRFQIPDEYSVGQREKWFGALFERMLEEHRQRNRADDEPQDPTVSEEKSKSYIQDGPPLTQTLADANLGLAALALPPKGPAVTAKPKGKDRRPRGSRQSKATAA